MFGWQGAEPKAMAAKGGGARACGPMVFLRFGLRFKLPVPKFKAGKRQQFFTHLGASLCGPLAGLGLKV